jgi:uncharacterized protein YjbI with pentapeptide repeats
MRIPLTAVLAFAAISILITGCWDFISGAILPNVTWGLYSRSFFENVLVEAHGAVLDLLVVGVILYWFEQRRDRRNEIARLEEEFADLRLYRAPDAPYRTLGTIRRLLALDKKALQISEMTLSHLELKDLTLSDCNMHATVFTDSRIRNVRFENCRLDAAIFAGAIMEHTELVGSSLKRAKFQNARLNGLDLTLCQIQNADFTNASLRSANLKGLDCKGVIFKNADLRSANFIGARNLDPNAIAAAKCVRGLKSDDPRISAVVAAHQGK